VIEKHFESENHLVAIETMGKKLTYSLKRLFQFKACLKQIYRYNCHSNDRL